MTLVTAPHPSTAELVFEDLTIGPFASGFGLLGDGRRFSFRVHRGQMVFGRMVVEVYRPRLESPVPLPEDVMVSITRSLADVDVDDADSLAAAVRETVAATAPLR